jgi:zinc protease
MREDSSTPAQEVAVMTQPISIPSRLGAMLLAVAAALAAAPFNPAAAAAAATPVQAAPEKVTEVEGISEYRLANGLRVLLFPDQSKPTVTVNMTYLVGSRHEGYGETGMAHLLEHMLFKGTPDIPDIGKEFNARGMRFNGTTSLDRTNYYELFQAGDENLEWALKLEADRMINSKVAKADLDTEMTVVRNEYERGENAPTSVLIKRMQSVAYDWHNYGNSTIGNRSDIENVEIANLQAFYRKYYQPDNAVLLVAGKFDVPKALQLVGTYFSAIPRPTRQLQKLWTVEPTQDGERSFTVRRVGDLQVVALGYKIPSSLHPDAQAFDYASTILGDAPSGRLHKALVETGKAAQVAAGFVGGVDGGLQVMLAVVKKGDPIEPVQAEMIRLVEEFGANPPTAEEMDRARVQFANQAERLMTDHESIGLQLSEYTAQGDWRLFFLERDRLAKVTAAEVQAAASKYLRRDNRTVGIFLHDDKPMRADIPVAQGAADLLKDFKPKQALAAAEVFDPSPDNIDKRTKKLQVDGMKLALLQKKTRGETVLLSMNLPSGNEKTLFGQRATAQLAAQMLMRGTSRYTREQLQDEFTKLKVSGGVGGQGGSFETTRPNLAAAIRLAAHVLREPSFPAAEFEQLKKLMITSIESQLNDPSAVASQALAQHFNAYPKGDVRYSPSLQEQLDDLKAVTLDGVKRFHKAYYGAERAQIAIVGDFDEAEVLKAVREGFAGWRSGAPYARITRQQKDVAAANRSLETPDKENAVFLARLNVDMNEDDADYPALYMANYILGGGAGFDSRLVARIRVKEGLSYGAGSSLSVGRFDRAGGWSANAIAAPQNMGKVEAAFRDEMTKFLRDGVTPEELAKAKSGIAQQSVQGRAQDQRVVSELVSDIDTGRSFAWDKQFEARVQALTPDAVLAAARKYIDPAKLTIVKAGDFAKAARAP